MYRYKCLNPIAEVGLKRFTEEYEQVEDIKDADAVLVRSAKMHDMELPESLLAVARAGAGVNNIPLDRCAEQGIVVFNTPGANANGVKELVFACVLNFIIVGVNSITSSVIRSSRMMEMTIPAGPMFFCTPP